MIFGQLSNSVFRFSVRSIGGRDGRVLPLPSRRREIQRHSRRGLTQLGHVDLELALRASFEIKSKLAVDAPSSEKHDRPLKYLSGFIKKEYSRKNIQVCYR